MADLSKLDIWAVIPPEEKIELMTRAQAAGVFACLIATIIGFTVAVSLKLNWIIWGTLISSPFIYQFASGKKWRDLRPRAMLEYLAARSAARRYAFINQAKNLGLQLMFKGKLTRKFRADQVQEELEAAVAQNKESAVWVSLFNDIIVMISEKTGGAEVEFVHLLDDKITVSTDGDEQDYSSKRSVLINTVGRGKEIETWELTSRYPAALIVFEKKFQQLVAQSKRALPEESAAEESEEDRY